MDGDPVSHDLVRASYSQDVTGWVKWWFVSSWVVGMTFGLIGFAFQIRDGKPSGSEPWGMPLFVIAWLSGAAAFGYAKLCEHRSR